MRFTFCPLYSGSSGNALFIGAGNTRILIDAGMTGKAIERALREINDGGPLISFDMVHNVLLKTIDLYSVISVWHFAGKI